MRSRWLLWVGLILALTIGPAVAQSQPRSRPEAGPPHAGAKAANSIRLPPGVPEKVGRVLSYVDAHDRPMPGYEGGRNFGNYERLLPETDRQGRRVRYREWDVNPLRAGVNRGAERLVTGSDKSARYTKDHYRTFIKIR